MAKTMTQDPVPIMKSEIFIRHVVGPCARHLVSNALSGNGQAFAVAGDRNFMLLGLIQWCQRFETCNVGLFDSIL